MPVRARFRPHPRGFGFLRPVGADGLTPDPVEIPGADGAVDRVDRVFVPPEPARALLADDLVEAEVVHRDKGVAAEAVRLLARPRRLVAGRLEHRRGHVVVQPDPAVGSGWVVLDAAAAARAGEHPGQQVVVLVDAGVDGALTARALVAGPHPPGSPDAVRARAVVAVLGGAAPSLVPGGPEAVRLDPAEAELTHMRVLGQLAGGRRGAAAGLARGGPVPGADLEPVDRRHEACVTVDAAFAQELDDAVAASWDGDPRAPTHVAVHITDAAGAVAMGSQADVYARTVAATTYLASGASAPMLDPELAEGSHSLAVGQDRRVLSVRFAVLPDGSVTDVTLEPAVIRSSARLSYAAVEQWLAGDPTRLRTQARTQAAAAEDVVRAVVEAARRLGVERDSRMTLAELFEDAELTPVVNTGRITIGLAEPHAAAYRLIERLMVAANEAVGGWLVDRMVPALYRAHAGIDPQHSRRLRAAAEAAGARVPALEQPDGDPDHLTGQLLAAIEWLGAEGRHSDRDLLIAAATGATARATYDPDPTHHRGLGSSAYCHFTSPLRRYADLVVHRQVRAALAGGPPPYDVGELRALADWLGVRAGALARLETRERADLWAQALASGEHDGSEEATITGLSKAGLRIRLPRLGLRGMITAEHVLGAADSERAPLKLDEHGLSTATGGWRVGARIGVRFAGLDEAGRIEWQLAEPTPAP